MIACVRCGDSTAVQIRADRARTGETDGTGSTPLWHARCEGCGAEWTFRD